MVPGESRGVIKRSYRDPSLYIAYQAIMTDQSRQSKTGESEFYGSKNPTYAPTYKGALAWIRRHIMDIRKTVQLIKMYPSLMEDESLDPVWGLLEPMLEIGSTRDISSEVYINQDKRRSRSTNGNMRSKYEHTERIERGRHKAAAPTVQNLTVDNHNVNIHDPESSPPHGKVSPSVNTLSSPPKSPTQVDDESIKSKKTVYMVYNSKGKTTEVVFWPPNCKEHGKESEINCHTTEKEHFPRIGNDKISWKNCKTFDYSVRNTETPDIFKRIIQQTCNKEHL